MTDPCEASPTSGPPTSEAAPLSGESELFFGMQSDRVRTRTRWAGIILTLSPLVPYETVDGAPQFSFQILSELPAAAILGAYSLSLAGLVVTLASFWVKRSAVLALLVVSAVATALLLSEVGASRAAWDVLPLPESLTNRPLMMLLGLALAGAGLNLAFKPHTRRVGRGMLALSFACIALFYVWPSQGERPIGTVFGLLALLPQLPGFRYVLGYGLLLVVLCFPAVVALLSAVLALTPPTREPRLLSWMVTFGLPGLLALFVFRSLLVQLGDSSLPGTIGSVALLSALLGAGSAALERLGELGSMNLVDPERGQGTSVPRLAPLFGAAAVIVLAVQFVLARPPVKGVSWTLGPADAERDRLFGELLPAWSQFRARWDRSLRAGSSAQELVQLKGKERDVERALATAEPGVRRAVLALLRQSRDLDLAGRRWYRLVSDVNEANRLAGYPYYVDPSTAILRTKDGLDRRVALRSYRVEAVRPVSVDGASFATLHVRRLYGSSGHDRLMGFSRDVQPFALVVLDEIEPEELAWGELAMRPVPLCSDAAAETSPANIACGRALRRILDASAKGRFLVGVTERHELQHQIDGPHLPLAPVVRDALAGYAPQVRTQVNRELSAYLSELTTEGVPELGLVALYRMSRARQGRFAHFVGLLAAALLTDQKPKELTEPGALEAAYAELFALDGPALAARGEVAWKRGFGSVLPKLTAL